MTLFWSIVVSRTSPVATGVDIPSLKDKTAPLVYDDWLSRIKLSTFVLDDSTSVLLKVPVTARNAKFLAVNTLPTILPVAPVFAWVIVSPSKR